MSTSNPADAPRDDEGLIDRWLDEGDRLSENAVTTLAGTTVQTPRRLAAALADLRTMAERRRLALVFGAVAAAAIAVVALRAISHTVFGTGPAVASDPPRPAAGIPIPAPPPERVPMPVVAAALAAKPLPVVAVAPDPVDPAPAAAVPALTTSVAGAAALPEVSPKPAAAAVSLDDSRQECEASLRREHAKQALIACAQVARDNATSADAQVLLARADLLAGRDRETLRLARRALALDPRCADAYLLIGSVQQAAGRKPDARIAYEAYLHTASHGPHASELRAILKNL